MCSCSKNNLFALICWPTWSALKTEKSSLRFLYFLFVKKPIEIGPISHPCPHQKVHPAADFAQILSFLITDRDVNISIESFSYPNSQNPVTIQKKSNLGLRLFHHRLHQSARLGSQVSMMSIFGQDLCHCYIVLQNVQTATSNIVRML